MVRWAFDTLGIEVTKDKKIIKKAYSALVRKYHPEEHPDEWSKIHKAYQAAMEFAEDENAAEYEETVENEDFEDDEETVEEDPAEEIPIDDDYNEMFQEAHKKWKEEKSEKALALARRLDELFQTPVIQAGKEWQHFFAAEFLPGAEPDELYMLFEAISANEISLPAAEVIIETMRKRKGFYQASMETNKAALADAVMNCIYQKLPGMERAPVRQKRKRKGIKGILKELLIGAGIGALALAAFVFVTAEESSQNARISQMVVQQLNEKYGEDFYSEGDIEVERDETYKASQGSLICYKVTEKKAYEAIAYMIGEKEDFLCFDKLEALDIRQALEEEVNERTGRPEGKLYWKSSGEAAKHIRDGYFHEKYEGSVSEFLKLEAKARKTVAGTDYYAMDGTSSGENGNADYYVSDREVQTIEQRLELGEMTEDKEFLEALEQCAADYGVQICGIMLPQTLFEERMRQADWNEDSMRTVGEIVSTGMYPPMSFSMMTGWYVCAPPDKQEYLNVKNGMYSGKVIDMAEGIRGSENYIRIRPEELAMPEGIEFPEMSDEVDLTGCMKMTEMPDVPDIRKNAGQKTVSFCLAEGYELDEDYCLVIDKEMYGIPDSGYQVLLTTYESGDEGSAEELELSSYSDPGANIRYNDALDGEGYLFVEYPRFRDEEKAPVLTIVY